MWLNGKKWLAYTNMLIFLKVKMSIKKSKTRIETNLLSILGNEIDGQALLDFDTKIENELIPIAADRIAFRKALKKLR